MTKQKEYNSCVHPLICDTLDKIGVGSFRSESYILVDEEKPENGCHLVLNGIFTASESGIFNVPLNSTQISELMNVIPDNVHFLNLGFNNLDDDSLEVILRVIKERGLKLKNLSFEMNNFSLQSIDLLKNFNESNVECEVYTEQYHYSQTLFNYENVVSANADLIDPSKDNNGEDSTDDQLLGNCLNDATMK